jgi:cyclic pyranopterin phosphate synthase
MMLTHLDEHGHARMVDVSAKPESERTATAEGRVWMHADTLRLLADGTLKKGDAVQVARIAGIMGAKQTSSLIPLCHPIPLSAVEVAIALDPAASCAVITATVRTVGQTGVEMEALTAVTTAALTLYDMVKAVDRGLRIGGIRLLSKRGGVHGDYDAPADSARFSGDGPDAAAPLADLDGEP